MNSENWYKVDNVAKVFLATYNRRDTRSLRVSCTLKDKIDGVILGEALRAAIRTRPQLQVRIRRGFFWHYIENTEVLPVVREENTRPCPILYGEDYRGILHYSVTYYGKRINLDLFHALSDGTGAMEFLNILVLNYLKLKYPNELREVYIESSASADDLEQNSFKQFYGKSGKAAASGKKAYHIRGLKLPYDQLQFFELHMKAPEVLMRAKELKVSLTSYLGAQMMLAIQKDMPLLKKKQPVTISIPVNLRNFYPSKTARNFFNNVQVSHVFTGDETIEALAREFDDKLKGSLEPDKIRQQMDNYQKLERIFFVRMVPLFIKQPVVKYFSKKENQRVSAVISNLGVISPPREMVQFIEGYSAFCSHSEIFVTVSSFEDELVFGITSAYNNTGVLKNFVRTFTYAGQEAEIYATEVIR
ncbi:MAG: hypothetical protein LUG83_09050 [Lachnospiraceae bacterium]|nr:hypothetical protein [Lachnospiraceae bacterium]